MIYHLIWLHFLADFVAQTDQMAKNKSTSNGWLAGHIAAYTAVMGFGLAIVQFKQLGYGVLSFCLINGAAHFCTDYVTSRITRRLWSEGQVHNFFVVIGFDQAVHLTTLVATMPLLIKGA